MKQRNEGATRTDGLAAAEPGTRIDASSTCNLARRLTGAAQSLKALEPFAAAACAVASWLPFFDGLPMTLPSQSDPRTRSTHETPLVPTSLATAAAFSALTPPDGCFPLLLGLPTLVEAAIDAPEPASRSTRV